MSVSNVDVRGGASFGQRLQIAGMWFFLAPLIVTLGTVDILTNGQSRHWPFDDR
jgi:hypothetical protein